jgi:RNA polymerase sigma-70 factor, ECF subfamily
VGLSGLTDETLMQRVRDRDDRRAFAELVQRHQKKILNFYYRAGVQYDCEDLVQKTFLRLYRSQEGYQPSAKLTTFLFIMARQVWIDELRKRERTCRLKREITDNTCGIADSAVPRSDARLDLEKAMRQLPEQMRLVVELGAFQNLPYAEIAEILEIPIGTVKSRMFNALRRLRIALEE